MNSTLIGAIGNVRSGYAIGLLLAVFVPALAQPAPVTYAFSHLAGSAGGGGAALILAGRPQAMRLPIPDECAYRTVLRAASSSGIVLLDCHQW